MFNIFYVIDITIKYIAKGKLSYKKTIDQLDWLISIANLIVILRDAGMKVPVYEVSNWGKKLAGINIFRILRLMYKTKTFKLLRSITKALLKTIIDVSHILILLFIIVLTASGFGRELFAYELEGEKKPRLTYDTVKDSVLTTFVLFFSEGWPIWMHKFYRIVNW